MTIPMLVDHLREYHQWRVRIANAVHQIAKLSIEMEILPSGTMLRMENLAQEIARDHLRISFLVSLPGVSPNSLMPCFFRI